MGGSKLESDGGECGVGSIVWVRRRNGSWWPGKILEPEELTTSHLTSPRTGTPVKLLGRDDASVDWYNLEKSKRVKAFRCGEFDDCIERAEASLGMPTRKREKYARREDAILHALELEKELLKKQGKLGVISDHVSNSSGSVKKESVTSSGAVDISTGNPGNISSNQFSERPEISLKDKNVGSPLNLQKAKGRDQPSFEDEHSEVIPRMRGLKDLELRTAPPKRKLSSPSASDGSGKLTVDNNCQTPSSSAPGMGRTSPANGEQTGVFRSKRSMCIYLPAVSGETLDHKEIPPSQMGMSHLQFEDGYSGPRTGFSVEESSSGFMEDDETDSSESESESEDDSSETELDMDEEMTPVSGASVPREAEFGSQALEEHGSTSSEEHDQSALSGDMSHPHPHDRISSYEAVSKWQLKGKRNIRHLTKSSADGTDRKNYDGYIHGTRHEVKGVALKQNKSRQGLSFWRNDDFSEAVDDADSDDREFCTQMTGLDGGYGYRLRAASKGLNSFSRNMIDWDNMTWGDQPTLRGHWGNKVGQFHPGFIGRYNFGGRTRSMLVDVDLKVQASYQKGRVPIVSTTSKLNGKAIIGHPIQIEAVEDGSSECLIPANNYFGNTVVDHDRTLAPAWRTVRRTNFRVPRSVLSTSPNGDMAAESHSVLDEGRRFSKKSNIRSFGYKESPVGKNQSHNSRPTMGRKSLKKLPKKVSLSSNQKTRTLSSFAIDHSLSSRALYDSSNSQMNGLIKPESSGLTTVACIPVKLVFSRLLEKINRPPTKVSSKVVISGSDAERNRS
ncbi:hypothetical protein AB3S75_026773 [Citrus x aurantiifolia]